MSKTTYEVHSAEAISLYGWFDAWIVDKQSGQTVGDASALTREEAIELAWKDLAFELAYAARNN